VRATVGVVWFVPSLAEIGE